jgi:hypothetical protein
MASCVANAKVNGALPIKKRKSGYDEIASSQPLFSFRLSFVDQKELSLK